MLLVNRLFSFSVLPMRPIVCGCHVQEAGRRAGTENVLGIVGIGAAAAIVTKEQESTARHMAAMRDDLQDRLLHAFPQVLPAHVACDKYQRNRLALAKLQHIPFKLKATEQNWK